MSRFGRNDDERKPNREATQSADERTRGRPNERLNEDVTHVYHADATRSAGRHRADVEGRRERSDQRNRVRTAAYEIDELSQWREYMREDLGLTEGTEQFRAAESAWLDLKRKQYS